MDEAVARPVTGVVPVAVGRWPASLRGRFALWFGLLVIVSAVSIRALHYRATVELLARDIDVQLWSRLGALKAQERFAPDTLLDTHFRVADLFLPSPAHASGWTARHAVGLGSPIDERVAPADAFAWFAGFWRRDGTPVDALDLPPGFAWDEAWPERLDTLWTSADGRHRLAATAGSHGTVLVAGTPLAGLGIAKRATLLTHLATFAIWTPVVLGFAWFLLSRLLRPLRSIAATARRIRAGRFDERIDVAGADVEIAGVAVTLNDMLDRLDAVRVAQSRFNADVAHQLLNPVHGILLEADVTLSRPRTEAELATAVGRMGDLAHRIEALCEAFLTFSRTAALQPERLRRLELEPIVAEAVEQVLPAAGPRGIAIEATGSAIVKGDESLLHEVFVNLLDNAVAHSHGGGRIDVVTQACADGCRVSVVDHGTGVPPHGVAHLFERFHSASPGGGHGIGLALSRSILRAHGGDIVHVPTPGGGATFEVRFPATSQAARSVQAPTRGREARLVPSRG